MNETILRDGEIATILNNGTQVIMNVNTAFMVIDKMTERGIKDVHGKVNMANEADAPVKTAALECESGFTTSEVLDALINLAARLRANEDDENVDETSAPEDYDEDDDYDYSRCFTPKKELSGYVIINYTEPLNNVKDKHIGYDDDKRKFLGTYVGCFENSKDIDNYFGWPTGLADRIAGTWECAWQLAKYNLKYFNDYKINSRIISNTWYKYGNHTQWSASPKKTCACYNEFANCVAIIPASLIRDGILTNADAIKSITDVFNIEL